MRTSLLAFLPLTFGLAACSGDDAVATCGGCAAPVVDAGATPAGPFRVGLRAVFQPDADDEHVSFLTVAASHYQLTRGDIAGAWYYAATFPGGFDQGVDLDLHHEWGQVPESLEVEYTTPPMLADGPYDLALIIYTRSDITAEKRERLFAPLPVASELSAFSLSQERVKEGDRGFSNGVVRVNVEGGDAEVTLESRLPASPDGLLDALTDTILTVP